LKPQISDGVASASNEAGSKKESARRVSEAEELIPLTELEARLLICMLAWGKMLTPEQVVKWPRW
jgi:hypothetical protein